MTDIAPTDLHYARFDAAMARARGVLRPALPDPTRMILGPDGYWLWRKECIRVMPWSFDAQYSWAGPMHPGDERAGILGFQDVA